MKSVGLYQYPFDGTAHSLCQHSPPSLIPACTNDFIFDNCAFELIAPMSVFLSNGSPTINVSMRCFNFRMTSFATPSCTNKREPAQHT